MTENDHLMMRPNQQPPPPAGGCSSTPSSSSSTNSNRPCRRTDLTLPLPVRLPLSPPTNSAPSTSSSANAIAQQVSFSELDRISLIGRGPGGTVYKVVHRPTSRPFALKVIHGNHDDSVLRQIRREIQILLDVDHPHVVKCHEMYDHNGEIQVLLEFMDCGSLEGTHISQESMLSDLARQILSGLNYLRRRHIVHRDIKPSNLLINSKKVVKIADFGVSRILAQTMDSYKSSVGTIAYMSPERINTDLNHGYAGDIWSLGVSILEFYLGRCPFAVDSQGDWASLMLAICESQPPEAPPDASSDFRHFISCCLQRDPAMRWSAARLLQHPFIVRGQQVQTQVAQNLHEAYTSTKMQFSVSEASGSGLTQLQLPKEVDFVDDEKVREVQQSPSCSSQVELSLKGNVALTSLPTNFFRPMALLQILDLSHTSIKSLPKSLSMLVSLKSLLLRGCQLFMELSPQVGKLKNLEELDLDQTEIMDLPIEIRKLAKLRQLRVSFYQICGKQKLKWNVLIHPEAVSILSQLTELSIDVNPADKRWDDLVEAVVEEVCKSMTLRTLSLYLPKFELLYNLSWIYPSLTQFRFIVGHHKRRIINRVPHEVEAKFRNWDKCLKFVNGENIPIEIQDVLKYSTSFFLDNHSNAMSLSEFGVENMRRLKFCLLAECDNMETIIDGERHHKGYEDDGSESDLELGSTETVHESLEYVNIYYMDNLTSIWRGPNGFGCMPKLKILALHTCPRLINIFSHSTLGNFVNLEELILEDCPLVTSLVSHASVNPMMSTNFLPNLKMLLLLFLPQLVTISNGLPIAPKLESIGFYDCPKLKSISKMELSSKSLKIIKGESQWWKDMTWDESEWGNRPDYLMQMFSPINHEQDVLTQMAEDRDLFKATVQNESKKLDYLEERITETDVTKPSSSECICPSSPGLEEPEHAWSFSPEKKKLEDDESDLASEISELDDDEDKFVVKKWNCTENENKDFTITKSVSKFQSGDTGLFRTGSTYEAVLDDGYKWRKYGKKKNGILPQRNYYKCSTMGCPKKKMIMQDPQDFSKWTVKYGGVHNHVIPCDTQFSELFHHTRRRNVEDAAETAQNMISFTKEDENSLQGSIQEDNQQLDGKEDQMMRTSMRKTIPSPLPTPFPFYSTFGSALVLRPPKLSDAPQTKTSDDLLSLNPTTSGEFAAQSLNRESHPSKVNPHLPRPSPHFPPPSEISQLSATALPTHIQSLEKHPKQDGSMGKLQAADSKQHPHSPMRRKSYEDYRWRCYGIKKIMDNRINRYYRCTCHGCRARKIVQWSSDGQIANVVFHAKHNHLESQPQPGRTSLLSAFSRNIRASNHLTIKIPDKSFVTYEGGHKMDPEAASFVSMNSPHIYRHEISKRYDESSKGKRKRSLAKTTLLRGTKDLSSFREMVQTMTGMNTGTGNGTKKNDPEYCPST